MLDMYGSLISSSKPWKQGGGYIIVNGAVIDEAKPENVKATIDFTKEYGVYNRHLSS